MIVTVRVGRKEIEAGRKGECSACPVALAIRRITRPNIGVAVHYSCATMMNDFFERDAEITLPEPVLDFVRQFDDGAAVTPFEFRCDIPQELLLPEIVAIKSQPKSLFPME